MGKRLKLDDIKEIILNTYELELKSEDPYKNQQQLLTVFCPRCDKEHEISFADVKKHGGCSVCHPLQKKIRGRKLETPRFGTELELWRISHELGYGDIAFMIDKDLSGMEYIAIEAGHKKPTVAQSKRILQMTKIVM